MKGKKWLLEEFERLTDQSVDTDLEGDFNFGFNTGWNEARKAVHALGEQLGEAGELSKDWLKEEMNKPILAGEECYEDGYWTAVQNIEELLDQMKEPEKLSQEWIDQHKHLGSFETSVLGPPKSWKSYVPVKDLENLVVEHPETLSKEWIVRNTSPADGEDRRYVRESDLEKLIVEPDENQVVVTKPEIPQFVADYIEEMKDIGHFLQQLMSYTHDSYKWNDMNAIEEWIVNNEKKFVEAWYYGYTVKEEPKYYVHDNTHYLLCKTFDERYGNIINTLELKEYGLEKHEYTYELTEQEIRDYDERFWAFSEKVKEE